MSSSRNSSAGSDSQLGMQDFLSSPPSTFLPGYYSSSRDQHHGMGTRSFGDANYASAEDVPSAGLFGGHLLDGVTIPSMPRSSNSLTSTPVYEMTGTFVPPKRQNNGFRTHLANGLRAESLADDGVFEGSDFGLQPSTSQLLSPPQSFPSMPFQLPISSLSPKQPQQSFAQNPLQTSSPSLPPNLTPDMYNDTSTLPDLVPNSSGYPGSIYGDVPLPQLSTNHQDAKVSADDYAKVSPRACIGRELLRNTHSLLLQALEVYSHLRSALPHIQPISSASSLSEASSQDYEILLRLSSMGMAILSGDGSIQLPDPVEPVRQTTTETAPRRMSSHGGRGERAKGETKCLGEHVLEAPSSMTTLLCVFLRLSCRVWFY